MAEVNDIGALAPRNPRSPLPSGHELDERLKVLCDAYLDVPKANRDAAATLWRAALKLPPWACLELVAAAARLLRDSSPR